MKKYLCILILSLSAFAQESAPGCNSVEFEFTESNGNVVLSGTNSYNNRGGRTTERDFHVIDDDGMISLMVLSRKLYQDNLQDNGELKENIIITDQEKEQFISAIDRNISHNQSILPQLNSRLEEISNPEYRTTLLNRMRELRNQNLSREEMLDRSEAIQQEITGLRREQENLPNTIAQVQREIENGPSVRQFLDSIQNEVSVSRDSWLENVGGFIEARRLSGRFSVGTYDVLDETGCGGRVVGQMAMCGRFGRTRCGPQTPPVLAQSVVCNGSFQSADQNIEGKCQYRIKENSNSSDQGESAGARNAQ